MPCNFYGKVVIEPRFDEARDFSAGAAMVRIGGKYLDDWRHKKGVLVGYVKPDNEYLWPPQE